MLMEVLSFLYGVKETKILHQDTMYTIINL